MLCTYSDDELIAELSARGYEVRSSSLLPANVEVVCDFDAFWEKYPRKVSKKRAAQVWANMNEHQRRQAIDAIDRHTAMWWQEGRSSSLLPHASTWLSGERWEDEVGYVPERDTRPSRHTRTNDVLGRLEAK